MLYYAIYRFDYIVIIKDGIMAHSNLHTLRLQYKPKMPSLFANNPAHISLSVVQKTSSAVSDSDKLKKIFPNTYGQSLYKVVQADNPEAEKKRKVGVILSGGPAPGGHNVIAGVFDALKSANASSQLIGFKKGPGGLVNNDYVLLNANTVGKYRNTGGFDIIGSGRTKIETPEQFAAALETVKKHSLDALVVIGGDDSNTNAVLLAEYFVQQNCKTQVIGIPKTIDGDLRNKYIETSFGFDTAVKTYSELIGNIARDANSSKKYWHFIRLMGRSASHITLECALQTQPNVAIISEEVLAKKQSLQSIVKTVADIVATRAKHGLDFGVVLIPEGLIEFIPEVKQLIAQLNDILSNVDDTVSVEERVNLAVSSLSSNLQKTFLSLPTSIQHQLLLDRDDHGNVQVTLIETERMLIEMVANELKQRNTFTTKFSAQSHFFGYEARCAFPSNFDADYCYSLGYNAFILIANNCTGYISSIKNLKQSVDKWQPYAVPLTMMMNIEKRKGKDVPVIKKALVEMQSKSFLYFVKHRETWAKETAYVFPGAIQYFGDSSLTDTCTKTLAILY